MNKAKKLTIILLAITLMLVISACSTDKSAEVKVFTSAGGAYEVMNNNGEVKIKSNSDEEVYVYANILISWKDKDGSFYSVMPVEGVDYVITYPENAWLEDNGTHYFTKSLKKGDMTDTLFSGLALKDGAVAPEGYELSVDVVVQGIEKSEIN